jgi:hypothetical protein
MSFLLGKKVDQKPAYTGLQLNTSVATLPIPILWGRQKMSGNLIWMNGFTSFQTEPKGKGKSHALSGLTGGSQKQTEYRADIILALCEGPINGIGFTWKDQSISTFQYLMFNAYGGGSGPAGEQDVWNWTTWWYPSQALHYPGTAYMAAAWYQMGMTPTIGNLTFEVFGNLAGSGVNGHDADPAQVILDFLTNPRYGAGFDPASIDMTTLYGAGSDASLQTYCRSLGICFSPLISSAEAASSILNRWLQICNCAAVWSGGLLKFIPYGDTEVVEGSTQTFTRNFSIPYVVPPDSGTTYYLPAQIGVSSPDNFVHDGGVVYAESGIPLLYIGIFVISPSNFTLFPGTYGMNPIGNYIFSNGDEGKPVIMTYTVKAATGFAPLLTPIYDLGDADFYAEKDADPVNVDRADVYSLPNIQRIEVTSQSNAYSVTPVEARDQAQIEMYGPRVGSTISAHEICDEFTIGPVVAQLILQRGLYVRAKYTFKLSWEFCLLDPMDVVTITDLALGLDQAHVRIVSIEEDDNGLLTVTAEELVSGIATPAANPSAGSTSRQHSFSQTAISVNNPLIYQPPTSLTAGVAQVWAGASPQAAGASTQWGGANIWASFDNATYAQVATITQPLIQGLLSAPLPIAIAGTDPTHTLSVDLTMSAGSLSNVDPTSASLGVTRSLVDNELVSYTNATLTAANAYALTGLYRGLNGTAPAAHSTGSFFARLDDAIVTYDIPAGVTGQTIYFKFQSFNAFGGGAQMLSDCAVYQITIGSAGTSHPIAIQLQSGSPVDLGQVSAAPTITDDFGGVADAIGAVIDLGNFGVVPHPIAIKLASGIPLDLGPVAGVIDVSDDFGAIVDPPIHISDLGTVP